MSNDFLKARAGGHLCARATCRQIKGKWNSLLIKDCPDIKSDLGYLLIVVWLALFQTSASCAFSLWGAVHQDEASNLNSPDRLYNSKIDFNAPMNLLCGLSTALCHMVLFLFLLINSKMQFKTGNESIVSLDDGFVSSIDFPGALYFI